MIFERVDYHKKRNWWPIRIAISYLFVFPLLFIFQQRCFIQELAMGSGK